MTPPRPKLTAGALALVLAAGPAIAAAAPADRAYTAVRPITGAVRATTNFDPALRCMDELLSRNEYGAGIRLLATSLQDPKGEVGGVTRDMIVASASRMSEKSRFFDVLPGATEARISGDAGMRIVRGSITGYDKAVEGSGVGGGLGVGLTGIGGRKQQSMSVMTVTLYLTSSSGVVIPGTVQSVSIALRQKSKGGDFTGAVGSVGGFFELEFSQAEGAHQALRSLVDLALIQAVGAFAQAPYQRCLAQVSVDPGAMQAWRKTWDRMSTANRTKAVGDLLAARQLIAADAVKDPNALRMAIAAYQVQQNLPSMGTVNFETYVALNQAKDVAPVAASNSPMQSAFAVKVRPYGSGIVSRDRDHWLPLGDRGSVGVTVAKSAYVICYHTDTRNRSTRIFPNRERPNYRVQAGETLVLPGPEDVYSMESDQVGVESVSCMASGEPFLQKLPAELQPEMRIGGSPLAVESQPDLMRKALSAGVPDFSVDVLPYRTCSPCNLARQ